MIHIGHLALSRKPGQALVLSIAGELVTVRVGEVRDGRVTLEVVAPVDVRVLREELLR